MTNISRQKLHRFSGLFIAVFAGLHLFNHACSIYGAAFHIQVMETIRPLYRNLLVEVLLLAAVITQIITGVRLFQQRRKTGLSPFGSLQIWSGLYLAFFLVIHVSAVLAGRLLLQLDTNFYFGVAGINTFPLSLFFIPYYALAIMALFGHLAALHYHKMKRGIAGLTPAQQSIAILCTGLLLTIIIFYGLTNGFRGVELPEEYRLLTGTQLQTCDACFSNSFDDI